MLTPLQICSVQILQKNSKALRSSLPRANESTKKPLFRKANPRGGQGPSNEVEPQIISKGVAETDQPAKTKTEPNSLFKYCFKRKIEKYSTVNPRKHGDCPIGGYSKSSWKAGTFCPELGKSNQGQMGHNHNKGLQNRISQYTLSGSQATPPEVQPGATAPHRSGNTKTSGQGGSDPNEGSTSGQFLFQPISGTKKRMMVRDHSSI